MPPSRRTHDPDGPIESAPATDNFFSYQHNQIVLQFNGSSANDLSHRFLWNPAAIDQLLADEQVSSLSSAGAVLWPLADHLGTIRDLATHNSTTHATDVVNHCKYDSYGNLISESNAAIDEIFGYTGRLFDDATRLQYNTNRWFDSKTGRWISEDPIGINGGDTNFNRYVSNNPTDATDPEGLRGTPSPPIYRPPVRPRQAPNRNSPARYCPANSPSDPDGPIFLPYPRSPLPPGYPKGPGPHLEPKPGTPEWEQYANRCWRQYNKDLDNNREKTGRCTCVVQKTDHKGNKYNHYEPIQGQQTLSGCRALCKKWYGGDELTKVIWDDKWYDP